MGAALPALWWLTLVCVAQSFDEGSKERASAPALAETSSAERRKLVAQKLELLERLLAGPPGRRVEEAENAEATALLTSARQASGEARLTLTSGQAGEAEVLADAAFKSLTSASHLVGKKQPSAESPGVRYLQLREGLLSFREALDRARADDDPAEGAIDPAVVDTLRERAEALAEEGQYARAEEVMTQAYAMTVSALSEAREDQTLVYSRGFETRSEAYEYERKRNRNYEDLVGHLLAKGTVSDAKRALLDRYTAGSRALREEAESKAQAEDWDEATDTMKQATASLIRILQTLGLPILE